MLKTASIMMYIVAFVALVFGLLGSMGRIDFDPFVSIFLFYLLREASEWTMSYAISLEEMR